MQGFKEFLMRGNLVELAVAVIVGSVFSEVVKTFTKILMDIVGMFFGPPDFSKVAIGGVNMVYFLVVKPYNALRDRFSKKQEEEPAGPTSEELLGEIRDLLRTRNV